MTDVVSHVSPYRRIEIGSSYKPAPITVETESAFSKAIREALEEKQRAEQDRIWRHVEQIARGSASAETTNLEEQP